MQKRVTRYDFIQSERGRLFEWSWALKACQKRRSTRQIFMNGRSFEKTREKLRPSANRGVRFDKLQSAASSRWQPHGVLIIHSTTDHSRTDPPARVLNDFLSKWHTFNPSDSNILNSYALDYLSLIISRFTPSRQLKLARSHPCTP